MKHITTGTRLTFGLACLLASVLLLAIMLDIVPDRHQAVLQGRARLCEVLAVSSSTLVGKQDLQALKHLLKTTVDRDDTILSAAVRQADGRVLVEVGEHVAQWVRLPKDQSIETHVQVPILEGARKWGTVELRFRALGKSGWWGWLLRSDVRLIAFVTSVCYLLFYFYLRRMLTELDPSRAVPTRVRTALDTFAEGLLVIDRKGRIVLANRAFAEGVGSTPEALLGKRASAFTWRGPDGQPLTQLPWSAALEQKCPQLEHVLRLATGSQDPRTFLVNCCPVLGHDRHYHGVLVSFEDITQLEAQKTELEQSRRAAEAANEAKSTFLANMSHDLRTPLNAILGFADVLRRGLAESETERCEHLDTIYGSGKHLLHLINEILDLSKVEAGRLEVEQVPTQPYAVLRDVVLTLGAEARRRDLALDLAMDGPLPETICSDPLRLRQILTNLVGNALKFTERGGVTVRTRLGGPSSLGLDPDGSGQSPNLRDGSGQGPELPDGSGQSPVLRDGSGQSPNLLMIEVVDTGVGISDEALEKIFQPFTQADSSVSRKFGGTGLGLTISRRLAEALGGSLTVRSQVGAGSTFMLTIPTGPLEGVRLLMAEELAAEAARKTAPTTKPFLRRPWFGRVLVVDDGEANRRLIRLVLTRAGLHVTEAENGQQALDLTEQEPFDMILMDMQMPVLDGYRATQRLRDRGLSTPIIALTANALLGDEDKCRAAGCSGFLSKPVDLDQLLELVIQELGEAPSDCDESVDLGALRRMGPMGQMGPGGPIGPVPGPMVSALWGDDPELQAIVAGYANKLRAQVPLMQTACAQADWPKLAQMAHWLKGSAGTVGFPTLTEPAKQLEQRAKAGLAESVVAALDEIVAMIERIELPGYAPENASDR